MDNLLEKKVGIDTDNAQDAKVEPLVPMFGGKIAVHPQLGDADPVVPVDGAGTLVMHLNGLWHIDVNDDLVRLCPAQLVQLAQVLARDRFALSDSAPRRDKKEMVPIDPAHGNKFCLAGLAVD